jgi:hypothetical protein
MLTSGLIECETTAFQPRQVHRFLKGPIPWNDLCVAARLPGHALAVFLSIHHRLALTRSGSTTLPKGLLAELGVSRDTKSRALRELERASLIIVTRKVGRTSQIRLG